MFKKGRRGQNWVLDGIYKNNHKLRGVIKRMSKSIKPKQLVSLQKKAKVVQHDTHIKYGKIDWKNP